MNDLYGNAILQKRILEISAEKEILTAEIERLKTVVINQDDSGARLLVKVLVFVFFVWNVAYYFHSKGVL